MGNKVRRLMLLIFLGIMELSIVTYLYAGEVDQEIPEEYEVQKGDTLWDISGKFFKEPFKWPDIWQKNEYINNPDLIYPGNILLLRKLFQMELPEPEEKKPEIKVERKVTKPREKIIAKPAVPLKPEKVPVTGFNILRSAGFLVKEDFHVGSIIDSPLDRITLSKGDIVYTDIGPEDNSFVGKKFTIYRKVKNVKHPVTKKDVGSLIKILGTLEIKEFKDNRSAALITKSYEEISRNDLISDYIELKVPMIDPSIQPPVKNIQAYIIESKDGKISAGRGDIIYIDVGNNEGVVPGDKFVAYRTKVEESGFFSKKVTFEYPKIIIGEVKIILTRNDTATAIISKSLQELDIGDKIEYKLHSK